MGNRQFKPPAPTIPAAARTEALVHAALHASAPQQVQSPLNLLPIELLSEIAVVILKTHDPRDEAEICAELEA